MCVIRRGISSVEELEKVEKEEVEKEASSRHSRLTTPPGLDPDFAELFGEVYSNVELNPSVIGEFDFATSTVVVNLESSRDASSVPKYFLCFRTLPT